MTYLRQCNIEWIDAIEACLQKPSFRYETELLTDAVTLLATNGWEQSQSTSFGYVVLDAICQRFQIPLSNAYVDCSVVQVERDDMVDYGRRYLNLVQEDYWIIWWKIFNAVAAKQWSNVLAIIELLFCLPLSYGHLERVFSQLKLIRSDRRTCFGEDTLDHPIRINVEAPSLPLFEWDASGALDLWLKEVEKNTKGQTARTLRPTQLQPHPLHLRHVILIWMRTQEQIIQYNAI